MLVCLPLLAFGVTFLALLNLWPQLDWRRAWMRTALLCGAYMLLVTELLSLFRAVTVAGLALAWALPALGLAAWLLWRVRRGSAWHWPAWSLPPGWAERGLLLGVLAVLLITATVAWFATPQTFDSLNYHLPRVAHWAQDRAVHHFATGIEVQNVISPAGEIALLQVYVLAQGDRLTPFVQWFCFLCALIAAALIAQDLGAGRRGQVLAAVAGATIPMAIVNASSTVNDGIAALWVLLAAGEVVVLWRSAPARPAAPAAFAALAAGLTLAAKPTAVPYLLPLGLLAGWALWRCGRWRTLLGWAGLALAIVLLLNAGHFTRNYLTYGNPIGDADRFGFHGKQLFTPAALLSNLVRNVALHTGTPWGRVNRFVYNTVLAIHRGLGLAVDDPRTTSIGPFTWAGVRTEEGIASNALHAGLALLALGAALLAPKRMERPVLICMLLSATGFVLYCILFKWQTYASRYHLTFFVLLAPALGLALERLLPARWSWLPGALLLVLAYPWLFSIESRPIMVHPRSPVGSIFTESRDRLFFANAPYLLHAYTSMPAYIRAAGCDQVGLMLGGGQAEYPLWVYLGAPRRVVRIEWLVKGTPSEKYTNPAFQPCAIICEQCYGPAWGDTLRGLPLAYDDGTFRLYLRP
jgi:hypothetical protein